MFTFVLAAEQNRKTYKWKQQKGPSSRVSAFGEEPERKQSRGDGEDTGAGHTAANWSSVTEERSAETAASEADPTDPAHQAVCKGGG